MNHPQEVLFSREERTTYVSTLVPAPSIQPTPSPARARICIVVVKVSIAVTISVSSLAVLIWLIYRPQTIHVAVSTATLARFGLNTTDSESAPVLSYNLTAKLAISNPNTRVSIYYDQLQVAGFYQGKRFGKTALPVSFQGTRHADTVPVMFVGNSTMGFGDSVVDAFRGDNGTGVFPVDLSVDGAVRYKFGELMTTSASTLSVKCRLPLQPMVASGSVECSVSTSD
ncbi:NDR1/HIN1-like protein 10 [Phragmites australis]|uniref:NDR1/HIN1-like protein 10 n=1 Tax=Phragmites australis TaxID=29695 RepID=UPI002D789BE2|nr:NDR1/HIN1-like protein 10 [Phragmites australis]